MAINDSKTQKPGIDNPIQSKIIINDHRNPDAPIDHGSLVGLNDNDHPQYYLDSNPDSFETPAELDARDTLNRDRSNHTGTQLSSTISDFNTAVASLAADGDGAYFFTNTSSDLGGGRREMIKSIPSGGGFEIALAAATDGALLAEFATVTGFPNVTFLPAGPVSFQANARKTAGTKTAKLYAQFYRRTLLGAETLLGTSGVTEELTGSTVAVKAVGASQVVSGLLDTDRLVIKIRVEVTGAGTDPNVAIDIQGTTFSNSRFPYNPVQSVSGKSGIVTLDKTDVGLSNVDNTSDLNKPISSATQAALDLKQDILSAANNQLFYQDNSSVLAPIPSFFMDSDTLGVRLSNDLEPDNDATSKIVHNYNINVTAQSDSASDSFILHNNSINSDNDDLGFDLGTSSRAFLCNNNSINHISEADLGEVVFYSSYFNIGNGTDPISLRGFSYNYGFGDINNNVTVNGPMQGYGFQPTFGTSTSVDTNNSYIISFYDFTSAPNTSFPYYTSFSASPNLGAIQTNRNYTGLNINPTIGEFLGSGSFLGMFLGGNLGDFDTGNYTGILLSPIISNVNNATGLAINMSSVTGTNIQAMNITGNVFINGALSLNGAISTGQLNSFYAMNPVNGGGNPQTGHSTVTSMTALDSVTTANVDTIGLNAPMLITLQDNSINTSGPFQLGFSSLAAACVIETRSGSILDYLTGAVHALNFSGASTGGTIGHARACRGVFIPNGITTVNNSYGFFFHEPFGAISSRNFGCYIQNASYNWFENGVKIGGTAGSSDTTSNKLEVEGSTLFNGNIGFYNTAPIAQPSSSGAATAGATYTATEQTMLQEVYDACRALGLMT